MDYKKIYNDWLESDYYDDDTKMELLAIKNDEKEIEDRFYKDLEFGTAGLRGIVEAGRNRMNIYTIRKASYGLANYFINNYSDAKDRGIAIAHDNRNMSREFCMEAARTIASTGIKVYYFDDLRTTPMLSYTVKKLNCIGGIVITASHNPPKYNGYKVYASNGSQIMPDMAKGILKEVDKIDDMSLIPSFDSKYEANMVLLDKQIDDDFIKAVKENLIRKDLLKNHASDLKIVYSPLCGTGRIPVKRILEDMGVKNIIVVKEEEMPDPNFAEIEKPNPEEAIALERGIKLLRDQDADLLVATDPDCDRVGVAIKDKNEQIILLTGNQIGGLLTEYIISSLKEKNELPENPVLIKTIVTSEFGADIAKSLGVDVENILTGFKFLGEKVTNYEKTGKKNFVFGYEESYGYLKGNQCKDKDAVVSTMMIAEMATYYKNKSMNLNDALTSLYKKYGYYREKTTSIFLEGKDGSEKINRIMDTIRNNPIRSIGNSKVIESFDFQNGVEGFPKSNVLKYVFSDKSWLALRPSGTEPKIKIYIGTHHEDDRLAIKKLEEIDTHVSKLISEID